MTRGKPSQEDEAVNIPRVAIDFRLPLPWLLGGAAVVLWGVVGMYFQLRSLSEIVGSMQADVKATNATVVQFASEQALIKFRLDKLEAARAAAPVMTERR